MDIPPIFVPFPLRNANDVTLSSVGMSTLKFFLLSPLRVLSRLLRLGRLLSREDEPSHLMSSSLVYGSDGGVPMVHIGSAPPATFHYPGPWSFFASGYAVALFAMALLLNRIQNIVVPSRRPPLHQARSSASLRARRWAFLRMSFPSVFPVDLSSTYSRVVLRLPTMYYILKCLVLWSVLLLQASDSFPPSHWKPFQLLDDWVTRKEMDEICWLTFLAVCGALCVGALTKGLEGGGTNPAAPFNLFGYSFMLHFYSSPLTHLIKPEGLPSRPDVNVIFTIYVPLFQLAMIHIIGVKKNWSNQRLIPTALCSALTLAHFHWVLWFSPSSYPLLNYVSCIFESLLLLVIAIAFSLNILTQLLLEGSITRPFVGHAASLMPKWDEDFSIVLLRLGIASLDATSVAGLGNEVSWIALTDHAETVARERRVQYGEAEMNRSGISSITHMTEYQGGRPKRKEGFANEIKRVKVGSSSHGDPIVDPTWFIEFKRFGCAIARCGLGLGRMAGRFLRGQSIFPRPPVASDGQTHDLDAESPGIFREGKTKRPILDERDLYERFLSGEVLSDDEDDEFSPPSSPGLQHGGDDDDDDDDERAEVDTPGEQLDTLALFSDLSATTTSSATAPVLLAHMTDTSSSPLTRRRYRNLVSGQRDPEQRAWDAFVDGKRERANSRDLSTNELRRNCVICTVEERKIICWPCRCLALCDDCRQNLASRHPASKHTCPCCRQQVEGFSRIYIP